VPVVLGTPYKWTVTLYYTTFGRQFIYLFIYDEIVQEYTEKNTKENKKTNEQRIGHTQRFNNKINVRSP